MKRLIELLNNLKIADIDAVFARLEYLGFELDSKPESSERNKEYFKTITKELAADEIEHYLKINVVPSNIAEITLELDDQEKIAFKAAAEAAQIGKSKNDEKVANADDINLATKRLASSVDRNLFQEDLPVKIRKLEKLYYLLQTINNESVTASHKFGDLSFSYANLLGVIQPLTYSHNAIQELKSSCEELKAELADEKLFVEVSKDVKKLQEEKLSTEDVIVNLDDIKAKLYDSSDQVDDPSLVKFVTKATIALREKKLFDELENCRARFGIKEFENFRDAKENEIWGFEYLSIRTTIKNIVKQLQHTMTALLQNKVNKAELIASLKNLLKTQNSFFNENTMNMFSVLIEILNKYPQLLNNDEKDLDGSNANTAKKNIELFSEALKQSNFPENYLAYQKILKIMNKTTNYRKDLGKTINGDIIKYNLRKIDGSFMSISDVRKIPSYDPIFMQHNDFAIAVSRYTLLGKFSKILNQATVGNAQSVLENYNIELNANRNLIRAGRKSLGQLYLDAVDFIMTGVRAIVARVSKRKAHSMRLLGKNRGSKYEIEARELANTLPDTNNKISPKGG